MSTNYHDFTKLQTKLDWEKWETLVDQQVDALLAVYREKNRAKKTLLDRIYQLRKLRLKNYTQYILEKYGPRNE